MVLQLSGEGRSAPHNYGVGYRMPGTSKHTILAYSSSRHNKGINYYSGRGLYDKVKRCREACGSKSKKKKNDEIQEGTATGDSAHDNVRVFNERRFIYEKIGDESDKEGCNGGTSVCETTEQQGCIFPFNYKVGEREKERELFERDRERFESGFCCFSSCFWLAAKATRALHDGGQREALVRHQGGRRREPGKAVVGRVGAVVVDDVAVAAVIVAIIVAVFAVVVGGGGVAVVVFVVVGAVAVVIGVAVVVLFGVQFAHLLCPRRSPATGATAPPHAVSGLKKKFEVSTVLELLLLSLLQGRCAAPPADTTASSHSSTRWGSRWPSAATASATTAAATTDSLCFCFCQGSKYHGCTEFEAQGKGAWCATATANGQEYNGFWDYCGGSCGQMEIFFSLYDISSNIKISQKRHART